MGMVANFIRLNVGLVPALKRTPSTVFELLESSCAPRKHAAACFDLDKSWHLIHYFLTGRVEQAPPPLGDAILGGDEIRRSDSGDGPARLLMPDRVTAVAVALATIQPETLPSRHPLRSVANDVYLADTWKDSPEDRSYVIEYFKQLQLFYANAAKLRQAVIIAIT
ncbi:MAG: YfbM family protein [Proteobacteria bacterium]|nr:YfbM family protein [Pseudomonadota bacterium]